MAGGDPCRKLLLVEGSDDEHVVKQLCEHHGYTDRFGILDKKGFPSLKAAIGPEIKAPRRLTLGILVDANDNPASRWDEVGHQLRQVGYRPPLKMASSGTIIDGPGARPGVGIWLMPDNDKKGQLENFIQELIPGGDPIWPLAEAYIDKIPAPAREFKSQKIQRARIHAWLAARKEPRKMGLAIRAGDLDADAQLAMRFMAWLRRLFDR